MSTWLLILVLMGEPVYVIHMPSEAACRAAVKEAPASRPGGYGIACLEKPPREPRKGRAA